MNIGSTGSSKWLTYLTDKLTSFTYFLNKLVDLAQFGGLVLALQKAFNDLLIKLDNDAGISDTDYESTLKV